MGKKARRKSESVALTPIVETRDVTSLPGFAPGWNAGPTIYPSAYPLTIVEATGIATVRRCVSLIANAISGREWQEWEGKKQLKPSRLVKRPAAMMTRREWAWRVVASMALDDIAHIRMVGGVDDEGVPGSLIPIPRDAISPTGLVDPYGVFPPTAYQLSGVAGSVSAEEIITIRSVFWPGVPPHLVGILRMARSTLMQSWAADNYASRYWQHGGSPTTVLTSDQEVDQIQAEDAGNLWRLRRSLGPDFPAVLGKGMHAEAFGADTASASAVEARREMVLDIGRLFGVSEKYLFVGLQGSSMTYANVNDEAIGLQRFTLDGFIEPMQDCISDLLPGDAVEDRRMIIDMTTFTRASQEARYRAWAIATGAPWMGADEVREQEGLPPDDRFTDEVETKVSISAPPETPTPQESPVGDAVEEGAVTA
jgi:HK97 family phage portal protein